MKVIYEITINEKLLDGWARELYSGEEYGDPVPGEPTPGRHLADGWIEEARMAVVEGYAPDTAWWGYVKGRDRFIDSIDVQLVD